MDEDQQARATLGGASVLRSWLERAALTAGVVALFVLGYFAIGTHVRPASAHALAAAWDAKIPFVAGTVWIYLWLFPASLLPLFLVRCPRLFRRTIVAYALVIAASLIVFAAFPVTSRELRESAGPLDRNTLSPWAVATLYRLDPPYNLFPSLHLSVAALAAMSAWMASRAYGAVVGCGVVLVAVSVLTVKQHFIADAAGGLVLAAAAYAFVLRPYRPEPGRRRAYGWQGPAAYAGLMALVYAGFVAAFLFRG
jgi:membrane-associated phospholipid phosphatase